jgi:hypothetical protein
LCSTAGQACGPARGIRSPGDLRRRRHLVDDPSSVGSGTCASWASASLRRRDGDISGSGIMPRRLNDTLQTERYRRCGQPQGRSVARPCACLCGLTVSVARDLGVWGATGGSRVCDRKARSWHGGCGCAFWHVARACHSSHDAEPTESPSPQTVPAAAPAAPCSVAMCHVQGDFGRRGHVALFHPGGITCPCLPARACNAEGPEAYHLCAGLAHCQLPRCPGRSEPLALVALLYNGMKVGSQTQICAGVGSSGSGSWRLLTRSVPTAYVPSHRAMQRRLPVCIVACER